MKKTQFYAAILILLILPGMGLAGEGTWTRKADMPTPRMVLSAAAVDGIIYAFTGTRTPWEQTPAVEAYNPTTDTWVKKADIPHQRRGSGAGVVDGIIYVIGGWEGTDVGESLTAVEAYDPVADTWTRKTDMPAARGWLSASVVDGIIYVIGGSTDTYGTPSLSTVEAYDPATDTWMKKADMPTERWGLSTSAVDGRIYAIGGSPGGWDMTIPVLSTVEVYDPATDTWTKGTDMPTPRAWLSTSVVNGKIYAIGGLSSNTVGLTTVEVYDPATDTWTTEADMPISRGFHASSIVGRRIYVIGGSPGGSTGPTPVGTVEEYLVGIQVRAVSPDEGSVTGGEPITLFGSGFPPDTSVTIGGEPLAQMNVTDVLITGVTPPGTEGEQDIQVIMPDDYYPVLAGTFFYYPLSGISVRAVTPDNGKQAGDDVASIIGRGFLPGATVTIGGVPAVDMGVTSTLIAITIPPGTEGAKDVIATNPDGQKGILRGGYTYNPFPIIEDIEPDKGRLAGQTQVTITGDNFMEGIVVTIGENRVAALDFFSPTELRLKTPTGTAGAKTVKVVNPDGQEAILKDAFTHLPAPTISSVEPNVGPLEGGTRIIITGTGFTQFVDVVIGAEAPATVLSSTQIRALTSPSTRGPKDVTVINSDGQGTKLRDGFTYNPAPVITGVTPNNGRLAGGTRITVQGSGFLPGSRVLLSVSGQTFTAASSVELVSASIINTVTPPGRPGVKDVKVSNPDKQFVILPEGFIYNPMPIIMSITPDYGVSSGGTKVIIEGTGFLQGARVIVGERSATTMVRDDMTIEAVTPANPPGVWDVRVVNPDTQEAVVRGGFVSVGQLAYNFPNPFQASRGTTFRYVTDKPMDSITVRIFNMAGVPIDVIQQIGSNEVEWHNTEVHGGLYVYLMEVRLEDGNVRQFRNTLEVYK